ARSSPPRRAPSRRSPCPRRMRGRKRTRRARQLRRNPPDEAGTLMPASNVLNIFRVPELRKRIGFTLALLAVYRVGIFITVPGVNRAAMRDVFKQSAGGFLGLFNMFSGGAMETFSIFSLGIMPYISASIILQLLTVVVPSLEKIQKEGQS